MHTLPTIDYTYLQPEENSRFAKLALRKILRQARTHAIFGGVGLAILLLPVAVLVPETIPMLLFVLLFVLIIAAVAVWIIAADRSVGLQIEAFSADNNFAYKPYDQSHGYAGLFFNFGDNNSIRPSFTIPLEGGAEIEIGNGEAIVGSGKNQHTRRFGFARASLPRRLPNMLLDARSNNYFGRYMSNLPSSLQGNETLSLEGNFNNNFTLYVPKKYERDALYVFTPDVMLALQDHATKFDVEIVDDQLFLYSDRPFSLQEQSVVEGILAIVARITPELHDQTDYYADERVGNRQSNLIAPEGQRLKKGMSTATIALLILFIAFQLPNVTGGDIHLAIPFALIIFAVAFYFIRKHFYKD